MQARLQHPMYTAAALAAANPVLLKGEVVYESDTLRRKVGDGTAAWNALPYESVGGSAAAPTGPFPGYRQIAGRGSTLLDRERNTPINFTAPVDPESLFESHICFDAYLLQTANGGVFCIPAVFHMVGELGNVPVLDFVTGALFLTDSFASLFARIHFRWEDLIVGCDIQTFPKGFLQQETLELRWHGVYLEERLPPSPPVPTS